MNIKVNTRVKSWLILIVIAGFIFGFTPLFFGETSDKGHEISNRAISINQLNDDNEHYGRSSKNKTQCFIYRPAQGAMWDPSVIWHKDRYYAFMMYNKDGDSGLEGILQANHCFLATSKDGVHWQDYGIVLDEEDNHSFFKPVIANFGDYFIMNHGVFRRRGEERTQDMLRFYESKNLYDWHYLYSSTPDTLWYRIPPKHARWDHMYMLPKEEGNPRAGYWGYVVSVIKPGVLPSGVGMMESIDGRKWTVLEPAPIEWPDGLTPPPGENYFEWGGCERIGGKYYLIGGYGSGGYLGSWYSMYTFVADNPRGPFRPDVDAFRLSGTTSENIAWLAAWVRGENELLISNYASMSPGDWSPWMLPLRKPVVDDNGHLRLSWWEGNNALKGKSIKLSKKSFVISDNKKQAGFNSVYITEFNPQTGILLEGTVRAKHIVTDKQGENITAEAGIILQENSSQAVAILLGIGTSQDRETRIGRLTMKTDSLPEFDVLDITGKWSATVTGIEDGKEHSFRLVSRLGLFELYVDDLLVQTYYYKFGTGRVGFVVDAAKATFTNIKAWELSCSKTE